MSINLKLDDGNDLVFEANNFVLIDGGDNLRQKLQTHLQTFQGEWFLDPTLGVPWFQQVFKREKGVNVGAVTALFREELLATDGVQSIEKLTLDFDAGTRNLSVTFRVTTTQGIIDETLDLEV